MNNHKEFVNKLLNSIEKHHKDIKRIDYDIFITFPFENVPLCLANRKEIKHKCGEFKAICHILYWLSTPIKLYDYKIIIVNEEGIDYNRCDFNDFEFQYESDEKLLLTQKRITDNELFMNSL